MLKSVVIEEKKLKHSPWARADNPLGPSFGVNRKASSLWPFVPSLKRISSNSDFIYHDLIAAGQGQTIPGDKILMSTETSCHLVICYSLKKISLKSDFIQHFFHDFIHVYSPRAGVDNSLGTKCLCQQEHLVTLVICRKFQKNLF